MKKIVVVLLAAMLLGTSVSAAPARFVNETDGLYSSPAVIVEEGGKVKAEVTVQSAAGGEQILMLVSLYADDKLVGAGMSRQTCTTEASVFTAGAAIPEGGYDKVNVALVNNDAVLTPVSVPAFSPAKADAALLAGLSLDGVPLEGFDRNKKTYEVSVSSGVNTYPRIQPYVTELSSVVDVTDEGVFPGKQTITVTDTNQKQAVYELVYAYNKHIVKGASSPADFETDPDASFTERSKTVVAANINKIGMEFPEDAATDGMLRTNFHAKGAAGGGDTGSRPLYNRMPSEFCIEIINDPSLVGCDYFTTSNGNGYRGTIGEVVDTSKGDLFSFELTDSATIAVITTVNCSQLVAQHGFRVETGNPVVGYLQGGVTQRPFNWIYKKDYNGGDTVTIPGPALAGTRPPVVVVVPRAEN